MTLRETLWHKITHKDYYSEAFYYLDLPISDDLYSGNMSTVELHIDIGVLQEWDDKSPGIRTAD